jgi:hypothetical protein
MEFAAKIGITRETYADWERAKHKQLISKPADRLVRYIYLSSKLKEAAIRELENNLGHIEKNNKPRKLVFNRDEEKEEWNPPCLKAA